MKLSALDLSPIPAGSTAGDALRGTIDLARHVESLGFTRFWVAEHHNAGSLACSAPEILVGQVAAATRTIRVGTGGIMLPNHAPLKVAETFRVLEALFPGRIDLGLGRAGGTDARTARALRRGASPTADDFPEQLDELLAYLAVEEGPRGAFDGGIRAIPIRVPPPAIWILGSSDYGGALAAKRQLPFAFSHLLNPDETKTMIARYRRDAGSSARVIVAVGAVCAETDEEAERLASSGALGWVRFSRGLRDLPLPTVEEALAYPYDAEERAIRAVHAHRTIVGSPARVRAALLDVAEEADEIMIMTQVHDQEARRRSYTLIAEAMKAAAHHAGAPA